MAKSIQTQRKRTNIKTDIGKQGNDSPTHVQLPLRLHTPFNQISHLLLCQGLPQYLLPRPHVPRACAGHVRPGGLHRLHPLFSRRGQLERVKLLQLLLAWWQRGPPCPGPSHGGGPKWGVRGFPEPQRLHFRGLRVAVLELKRSTFYDI